MHSVDALANFSADNLREQVQLMAAVIDNFPGGISLFDKNLNMVLCNAQQRQLLDYPDELFAQGYPSLEQLFRFNAERGEYGLGDVETLVAERMELARQRTPHAFERARPNGIVLEVRGVPLPGGGFVTTYCDVTQRKHDQALIAHLAHHDALSGLPNRKLMLDRLEQTLARVDRGERAALLYLDLDGFKAINDLHGHATGDALLQAVAERARRAVRSVDTLARVGGDEFVVTQVDIHVPSNAAILAERLIATISEPYLIEEKKLHIGTSIGIAFAPRDGRGADELLRNADAALYRCKRERRGTFRFYDSQMTPMERARDAA